MIAGPGKWAGPVGPPHAAVITRLLQHAVPSTEKEHSPRRISEYSPQGTACCSSLANPKRPAYIREEVWTNYLCKLLTKPPTNYL